VWRDVRDELEMEGFVSHTLRMTVASFLDDADVSTRKISDQLGHSKVSMSRTAAWAGDSPTARRPRYWRGCYRRTEGYCVPIVSRDLGDRSGPKP
jgi:integrase